MKPMTLEWIEKAEGDHKVAADQWDTADPVYDAICFHAQQCAEKHPNAWLVEQGVGFPKIHDLELLARLSSPSLPAIEEVMDELRLWTSSAVEARYPGVSATRGMRKSAGRRSSGFAVTRARVWVCNSRSPAIAAPLRPSVPSLRLQHKRPLCRVAVRSRSTSRYLGIPFAIQARSWPARR